MSWRGPLWRSAQILVSDILFYESCKAPKERNLLSQSHLYSNGFSISQSLFKDKTSVSLRMWRTKMVVLFLQNNKNIIIPYVAGVSVKLNRVFNKHHLPVHFKPGNTETEVSTPKGKKHAGKNTAMLCKRSSAERNAHACTLEKQKHSNFLHVWKSDWIAALFSSGFLSEVKVEADFIWICPICIKFECGTWKWIYILMLWRSGTQDVNAKNCSRSMCETVWIILRMLY